jgi:hypothetical protein
LRPLKCLATTRAHSNTSALCRNLHNHHHDKANYSSPRNRASGIPSIFQEITNTGRHPHSLCDSNHTCDTSLERLLCVTCDILRRWLNCDKGRSCTRLSGLWLTSKQVKHDIKAKLTQSATGSSGGEGSRNHVQVIANSGVASVLILLHLWQLKSEGRYDDKDLCWHRGSDALIVGIVAYGGNLPMVHEAMLTIYQQLRCSRC